MAENSNIEWTRHTFNHVWGCTKVSEGCKHCYADAFARGRFKLNVWGPTANRKPASEATWKLPAKWNRQAEAAGERHRVFCASMADVFEGPETCQNPEAYAVIRAARRRLFDTIFKTPHLDWLLLTKRPENFERILEEVIEDSFEVEDEDCDACTMADMWRPSFGWVPPNVWIGTSVENQQAADKRIPELLKIPAAVRFLSCEPLLGPVDIRRYLDPTGITCSDYCQDSHYVLEEEVETFEYEQDGKTYVEPYCQNCGEPAEWTGWDEGIHWVIAGGESGPKARPAHPDWFRSLRDQCQAAGVPFFFKQNGEWAEAEYGKTDTGKSPCALVSKDGRFFIQPTSEVVIEPAFMARYGKKAAGRLLDGRTWDEFPEPAR